METNKIYFGDAYKLIKLIPDGFVDIIYTDIPYLIKGASKRTPDNENSSSISKQIAHQISNELDGITDGIDYSIFDDFIRVLPKNKINNFIWASKDQLLDIMNYFIKEHKCYFNLLVWCKTNPTPMCNGSWLPDIEYCLHFTKGVHLNDGYFLKSKFHLSPKNKSEKDFFDHPTIKPFDLVKRHLLHASQPNDIVLDPFSGSGTTACASKETGRQFIAFEINEEYYTNSVDRLSGINATGQVDIFADYEQIIFNLDDIKAGGGDNYGQ